MMVVGGWLLQSTKPRSMIVWWGLAAVNSVEMLGGSVSSNMRHRHASLPFSWSCLEWKVGRLVGVLCVSVGLYVCLSVMPWDCMCGTVSDAVGLYVCLSLRSCGCMCACL